MAVIRTSYISGILNAWKWDIAFALKEIERPNYDEAIGFKEMPAAMWYYQARRKTYKDQKTKKNRSKEW